MSHVTDAKKKFVKARPTVDKVSGNVVKWEIEYEYSKNGYKSVMRDDFSPDVDKKPEEFTKAEILAECNTAQWDMVYESQYQSVMVDSLTSPEAIDFDHKKLK